MESPLYKVVFSGDLEEGYAPDVVKRRCAALFKKPPAQIESLFAGKSVTIKSGLTRQQAENYVRALRHIGAKARITTTTGSATAAQRPKTKTNSKAKTVVQPATRVDRLLAGFKGQSAPGCPVTWSSTPIATRPGWQVVKISNTPPSN